MREAFLRVLSKDVDDVGSDVPRGTLDQRVIKTDRPWIECLHFLDPALQLSDVMLNSSGVNSFDSIGVGPCLRRPAIFTPYQGGWARGHAATRGRSPESLDVFSRPRLPESGLARLEHRWLASLTVNPPSGFPSERAA